MASFFAIYVEEEKLSIRSAQHSGNWTNWQEVGQVFVGQLVHLLRVELGDDEAVTLGERSDVQEGVAERERDVCVMSDRQGPGGAWRASEQETARRLTRGWSRGA